MASQPPLTRSAGTFRRRHMPDSPRALPNTSPRRGGVAKSPGGFCPCTALRSGQLIYMVPPGPLWPQGLLMGFKGIGVGCSMPDGVDRGQLS